MSQAHPSVPASSDACTSILDNDLYKFTMQQAVLQHYPNTPCHYRFTNRSPALAQLPAKALPWLKEKINDFAQLRLCPEERQFLEEKCPFLSKTYLDWLQDEFRFDPSNEVAIQWVTGVNPDNSSLQTTSATVDSLSSTSGSQDDHAEITITGLWHQVILYEVPILALVSEAHLRFGDQKWSHEGQFEKAKLKAERLVRAGAKFAEFGTRRRRDFETQQIVLSGLKAGSPLPSQAGRGQGFLTGTSNLHFARTMDLAPIGTMAHEWFMGIAAILGSAAKANQVALERWAETYPGHVLGIALTDTFTTEVFLKTFKGSVARDWPGVRHDSGDPGEFMERMIQYYDQDPEVGKEGRKTKRIVFSDGLTVDKAIQLQEAADAKGILVSFGIGTHFTNDYENSPAMNIVIKLHSCAGKECVKLSDDKSKISGRPAILEEVKQQTGAMI